jgi:hypothetical protein
MTAMLTSIDDIVSDHLLPLFGSLVLINPVWLLPVLLRDDTKLDFRIGHSQDTTTSEYNELSARNERICGRTL